MIVLYGGRLVIERRKLSENWRGIFKMPRDQERIIDLGTPDVREAFIRGQYHYMALHRKQPVEEVAAVFHDKAKCWSCVQWLPRSNECSFGFPEARQTGGRFAARCELYDDGTQGTGTDGTGRRLLD
jgi:hypothetical protein